GRRPPADTPTIGGDPTAELPGDVAPVVHAQHQAHLHTAEAEPVHHVGHRQRDVHAVEEEKERCHPQRAHHDKTEPWHTLGLLTRSTAGAEPSRDGERQCDAPLPWTLLAWPSTVIRYNH